MCFVHVVQPSDLGSPERSFFGHGLRLQKTDCTIAIDQAIVERDIRSASSKELRTNNGGEHGARRLFAVVWTNNACGGTWPPKPCHIDFRNDSILPLHNLRQIDIFGGHEAAKTHQLALEFCSFLRM